MYYSNYNIEYNAGMTFAYCLVPSEPLFYIERGLHSRTEIGEREIDGSTVHIMGVVETRHYLTVCLSPPPPLLLT